MSMARKELRFRFVHNEDEAVRLSTELGGTYEAWSREDGCFIIWYRG